MKEKELHQIKEEAEEQLDTVIVSIEYVGMQIREDDREAPRWLADTKLEKIWRGLGYGIDSSVIQVFRAETPRLKGYLHQVTSGARIHYEFFPTHIKHLSGITS